MPQKNIFAQKDTFHQKDIWCTYGARCERTSKFFNSVIIYPIRETGGRRQAKIMLNLKVTLKL